MYIGYSFGVLFIQGIYPRYLSRVLLLLSRVFRVLLSSVFRVSFIYLSRISFRVFIYPGYHGGYLFRAFIQGIITII